MAEAQQEHRLTSYRDAYTTLNRLRQDAPPAREPSIVETMEELQDQIEALEAEVEDQ